jgi:protein-S-isoprenylcysteine O-methyltransferase Ste14
MAAIWRWSGGLVFVASLAWAGYVLTIVWPRVTAVPAGEVAPALLRNALLFTLFAAHHSLLARPRVKAALDRVIPVLARRTMYVWMASLLFACVFAAWQPVGHRLYTLEGAWKGLAQAAQLAGVALIALAARVIDPLELAGVRSPSTAELEVRGPYLWVRHPIYLGTLLLLWAAPAPTADRLWFACLSTAYFAIAVPWEEAALHRAIGEGYARYREQVRWRIVPGVY